MNRQPMGGGGITSACAEQTGRHARSPSAEWDHLRVCGADALPFTVTSIMSGSPPRVRSRLPHPHRRQARRGITSACAEQTTARRRLSVRRWDHLRVCGADGVFALGIPALTGSPPRVRSRRGAVRGSGVGCGITSACAEQTLTPADSTWRDRDHLRVCGADPTAVATRITRWGSPPRVRSRPIHRPL